MTANKPGAKGLPKAQALPAAPGDLGVSGVPPLAAKHVAQQGGESQAPPAGGLAGPVAEPVTGFSSSSPLPGTVGGGPGTVPGKSLPADRSDVPVAEAIVVQPLPVRAAGAAGHTEKAKQTTGTVMPQRAGGAQGGAASQSRGLPLVAPAASGPAAARPIPVQRAGEGVPVRPAEEEEELEPQEQLKRLALTNGPPWLISLVLHMVAVLIAGLIWLPRVANRNMVDLEAVYAEELGEQLDVQPFDAVDDSSEAMQEIVAMETLPLVDDPNMAPPEVPLRPEGIGAEVFNAPVIGSPLQGRELGIKQQLLRKYGGSEITEQAVVEGLKWLARQQQKDGSWSLKGPYANGSFVERAEAATAMALLAFQGAGNTHRRGQFKENVAKGIKALMRFQDAEGNFYHSGGNAGLYTQAQCTIALCELYGMTGDSALRDSAELAVKYCIEAQDAQGGWRYEKARDSDTSVTGWMVMALQSARMAGLEVSSQVLRKVELYLDHAATDEGAQYKYQPGDSEPKLSMTAEGLLCRQYLGWPRNDPRLIRGCEILLRHLPNWEERDVYYWYYATQVLHHMEGEYWDRWNEAMRELLPAKQEKQGAERGSWHPLEPTMDAWGPQGGRLYVTCLSLYMLEVYYRHLPIYSPLNKLMREP